MSLINESMPDLLTENWDCIKIRTFVGKGLCDVVKEEIPFLPKPIPFQLTKVLQILVIPYLSKESPHFSISHKVSVGVMSRQL